VMALLREVAIAPNRACIVVTHDNRIFNAADRIVAMEDGRIVAHNSAPDVLPRQNNSYSSGAHP
jgi:putative ABC transport system ATP-binding protein